MPGFPFIPTIPNDESGQLVDSAGGIVPYVAIPSTSGSLNALGNWVSTQITGSPGAQTTPNATAIAALKLVAQQSGIFLVGVALAYSRNAADVTQSVIHQLVSKQTSGAGLFSGGVPAFTRGVGGLPGVGHVLQADAAGGAGILLDGASYGAGSTVCHFRQDVAQADNLTAAGLGGMYFGYTGILNANGLVLPSVKTPFTIGNSVTWAILAGSSNLLTYESLSFWAVELPFG